MCSRMAVRFRSVLLIAAFLAGVATGARSGSIPIESDLFRELKGKIVRLVEEKTIPSLSLAVVRDGEIIWEEAFGLANLEKKSKAAPETLYPIASVTKLFTAAAVMILVERGLVDLDKSVNAYLGGAKLRAFEGDVSEATVRRILHHTSGLPMYWNFDYGKGGRKRPPLDTTLGRYGILVCRPGESYNYSNLGYAVLESMIEHVSGKSYQDFLEGEVFKPLKLSRTAAFASPPSGYDVAEKYGAELTPIPFCDQDTRGAGGIYATAHDLARFALLHLGRLQSDQKAIIKPETVAAIHESRDPGVRTSSYGLGMETGYRFGFAVLTHGGFMDGCRAHIAMIPSKGLAAAVLINGENIRSIEICDEIFAALLPEYARNWKAASPGRGSSSSPPAFKPPSGLVGEWTGMIKTHQGNIPVCLLVDKEGGVELCRLEKPGTPEKALTPLKTPVLNRGIFVVHFPQFFSLSDAPAAGHRTVLGLVLRENRLVGEASLIASDMSYSLPSFAELKRDEPGILRLRCPNPFWLQVMK